MTSVFPLDYGIFRAGKYDVNGNAHNEFVWPVKHNNDKDGSTSEDGKTSKPFFFCKLVARYPLWSFFLMLCGHLLMTVTTGILVASGYDLFPTNFETLPLQLRDQPWLKRDLAFRYRNSYRGWVRRILSRSSSFPKYRYRLGESVEMIYETRGGNIFDKNHLVKIKEIEDGMQQVRDFDRYCQMEKVAGTDSCLKPISALRFFDGTYAAVDPVFSDPNFDNIPAVLYQASINNATKSAFEYTLALSHEVTPTLVSAQVTRSLVLLGMPIQGKSASAAREALKEYLSGSMKPALEAYRRSTSQFEFLYYNYNMMIADVKDQAILDLMLAIGSMLFIGAFMCYHTRSLWITSFAIYSILSSFMGTNLIYRIVLDYRYFGFFHVLAIFIILGIGADDLFVFYDAWRATAFNTYPSLAHRLSDAYRKSALSMLITSLTTMFAFIASAVSPILATKSFGVFSGILVLVNYVSVITFFPTVVVVYHTYFEKYSCCCCTFGKETNQDEPQFGKETNQDEPQFGKETNQDEPQFGKETNQDEPQFGKETNQDEPQFGKETNQDEPQFGKETNQDEPQFGKETNQDEPQFGKETNQDEPQFGKETNQDEPQFGKETNQDEPQFGKETNQDEPQFGKKKKKPLLLRYFRDYHFKIVTHKFAKWIILSIFLTLVGFFGYQTSLIKAENEQLQLYKKSHHYSKAIDRNLYSFVPNEVERFITLYLVWGLKERDLGGCHFSAVKCEGTQVFDDQFDASIPQAQLALKALCDEIYNFTKEDVAAYKIRRDTVTGEMEVACFTRNMEAFLQTDVDAGSLTLDLPWNWSRTSAFMSAKPTNYSMTTFNSSFDRYLDIPLTYWLFDGFRMRLTDDYVKYNSLFGEVKDTFSQKTTPVSSVGNRIKFLAVQINTTLIGQSLSYTDGLPVVKRWEDFMTRQLSKMPASLQGGFQTTRVFWHWLYVQKALADNAVLGIAIGLSMAFPILTLATQNIILGFLATVSIGCVTVCVIGVVPLAGWKLGVLVSLNMCLVVGLAVDYIVHFAEGYHLSKSKDRKSRVRDTLEFMGVPVFSGACTTLGASFFMLFSEIQFFFQFGIFMFCTIGFSLLFSLGFFITLLGVVGPTGDQGDIVVFFKRFCCKEQLPDPQAGGNKKEST
ncbi:protein dispatched homolog 1-like [Haliotis rubra]|uniref:protein dispatched homolog 1-like n=1 Tax=Haliotis rubra TaxID=36100 RepID=UPI001EE53EC3|nr:protein dispatched homolog 1-like [Haliotis rubra]